MIWYMSLRSIGKVVEQMKAVYPPDLPIAIVYYAGYPEKEKVLKSTFGRHSGRREKWMKNGWAFLWRGIV
ncbi:MAG: hypothetical protein R2861_10075 [Desulfobacterales bacterium]